MEGLFERVPIVTGIPCIEPGSGSRGSFFCSFTELSNIFRDPEACNPAADKHENGKFGMVDF